MRDLPPFGDESAGYPAGLQPGRRNPAELAHERAVVPGDGLESPPELAGWADREQEEGHGDGAPVPGAGSTRGGAGSSPPSGRPPAAWRKRARRRGPRRTGRWLALSAAVVLAAAGGAIALARVTNGGASSITLSSNGTSARLSVGASVSPLETSITPSAGASANMGVQASDGDSGPASLAGILQAANNSVEGRGLLPAAKCDQYQQNPGGAIVCTAPVAGVGQIFYQNYSSLNALYDAYKTQVTELDGGTFRQNTGTCGNSAVGYAEFGWNQEEGHPHNYTVAMMASGKVGQMFASGRMACFSTRTPQGVSQDIVWTIDNGPAMGVAIGSGSPRAVYQLWASLHHVVIFRGTEFCGTADRMNMRDVPTGNLKVVPVCPPGVEALPASSRS